jgi:excisionase family DNA binding protein
MIKGGEKMRLNTIRQAATRLAVSTSTVRRLIEKAELPTVRVGRCLRLREDDVEAMIRRGSGAVTQVGVLKKNYHNRIKTTPRPEL